MSRESDLRDERYRLHQPLLQSELQRQEQFEMYQHVIKVETTFSISDVQNKLREIILRYTQNRLFLPIMHKINCIYVISELSEAEKSSVVKAFCSHHETAQAFRVKIVYFNDLISERLNRSVYSLFERKQALRLLHELERFSNNYYWLRLIIIESMHRHSIARWLKTWVEKKLQIIYIDTTDVKRLQRALITSKAIVSNDNRKRKRDVELIRSNVDLMLDNNDTFFDIVSNLLRFADDNEMKN